MTERAAAPRARGGTVAALWRLLRRNPDYRRLFLATVVSFLGNWFGVVAVSGFVTETTGRPGLAAVVYAATVLPVFLASPVAGVVADRVDRKRLMVGVSAAAAVPALGLLAAMALGSAALAMLCVATIAVLAAFFEPVTAASVPNVVDERDLSLAQAGMGSVWGTMLFVGAAVGGLVAATLGRQASFLLNAATFVTAAVIVLRIERPLRLGPLPDPASVLSHLGEVWRFVWPRPLTRALMVTKTGVGLANGIVGLLPAFALVRFGGGDAAIGLLFAARGLGALLGPFVGRALAGSAATGTGGTGVPARIDGRRLLLVCGGSIVAYAVAYTFLPLTGSLALAAGCVALAHAGGGSQWVLSTYGLQVTTPDAIRGRVMSLDFGLATLAIGLSSLAAGASAELIGLRATSWTLVGVALIYGSGWLWATRALWRAEHDPLLAAGPGRPADG